MNTSEYQEEAFWKRVEKSHRRGRAAGGLLIVTVGALFLGRELGMAIPGWIFTWKMLLIGIGLVIGIKHGFRRPGWLIPIAIGSLFLVSDFYPEMAIKSMILPVVLIAIGLIMIFKPSRGFGRRHKWRQWQQQRMAYAGHRCMEETTGTEDSLDTTSFMGGIKKNVISKNFRGGEITNVMGGSEINLSQADFEGTVKLEITQVFGGTRLIVPSHWEIKSSIVTFLGSVEDKRPVQPATGGTPKILVLEGTTVFGGIDIQSFA